MLNLSILLYSTIAVVNPIKFHNYHFTKTCFYVLINITNMKIERHKTSNVLTKDTYDRYISDIQSYPLLTREQEIELGKKAYAGDDKAREQMIKGNLRLVIKIAKGFQFMGLPFLDLVSEGNIGLMRAVERYNPNEFDSKFSSYASWLIKAEMRKALLSKSRMIRLPSHVGQKMSRIYRAKDVLTTKLQREPHHDEIAKEAQTTEATVKALFDFNKTSSIEEIEEEDGLEIAIDTNESVCNKIQISETISEMMANASELPEREQTVLIMRFGLNGDNEKTLAQIGTELGVSRERIRQLQNSALKKLKKHLKKKNMLQTVKG